MFAPGPFKQVPEPGGPLYAEDLQRLYGSIASLEGFSAEAPLVLEKGEYGVSIRYAGKSDYPTIGYIRNETSSTLEPFSVLKVTGVLFDETETKSLQEFKNDIGLKGDTPGAAVDFFVVTFETLPAGQIGRAVIAGVVPCQIDVTSASHRYAVPTPSDVTKLTSSANGGPGAAQILHKPTGTGTLWAYVRLSGGASSLTGESSAGGLTNVCVTKASSVDVVASPVTINSTSYTLVLTQTLTLAKATKVDTSLHLFWDGVGTAVSGDKFEAILKIDGTAQTQAAVWRASSADDMGHVSQRWYTSQTAAAHTLEVYAKRTSGSGAIQIGVNTDLVSIAETIITKETTNSSGTVTCIDDPFGCCPISTGTGGGTSYENSDCASSGGTLTIASVTLAANEILIVDFVAATAVSISPTATFDGNAMSFVTSASYTLGSYPVTLHSFYYLAGAATGNVVVTFPSYLTRVAARAVRIPNVTSAPYGTSTNSGASSTPITGTLGGSNTLPGYVHAAFVLGNPGASSTWTSPFNGEATDLDWCTDYRLSTGGTIAQTVAQTFTASLSGVTPSAWAGYEIYLLGGGGGGGGGGSTGSCCGGLATTLYGKPTGLGACIADGTLLTFTWTASYVDSWGHNWGTGWWTTATSCSGGPNIFFGIVCSGTTLTFYAISDNGTQVVSHSTTTTAVCSPFHYVATFSAYLSGVFSAVTNWSFEYKDVVF